MTALENRPVVHIRRVIATLALLTIPVFIACGEGADGGEARSTHSGAVAAQHDVLTEADAGRVIDVDYFQYEIGLPDKKGTEIHLEGDDASEFRWRFAQKPDALFLDWYAVDGQLAFETGDLIGDPTIAAKVLEFRGSGRGETDVIVELVERDPAARSGEPVKRLAFTFSVHTTGQTGQPHQCTGPC